MIKNQKREAMQGNGQNIYVFLKDRRIVLSFPFFVYYLNGKLILKVAVPYSEISSPNVTALNSRTHRILEC